MGQVGGRLILGDGNRCYPQCPGGAHTVVGGIYRCDACGY